MSARGLTIFTRSRSRSRSRSPLTRGNRNSTRRSHTRSRSRNYTRRSHSRSPLRRVNRSHSRNRRISPTQYLTSLDQLPGIHSVERKDLSYDELCRNIHTGPAETCTIEFNKQKRQHHMAVAHYPVDEDRYVKIYEFPLNLQGKYGFFTLQKFMNEIRFQSKASQLQHAMFSVPVIYQYGEVQPHANANNNSKMVYFTMQRVSGAPISPDTDSTIISQADAWLKRNCIVHNDLHTIGNIIKTSEGKYSIIDFGEASTEQDRHRCPFGRSVFGGTRRNT